jgi:hypothetical protein
MNNQAPAQLEQSDRAAARLQLKRKDAQLIFPLAESN